ncbi:MAG: patatin-like phospholipase family protein, partial [Spongiibacteraceae bacterium]|nr:patatin-like phospholipase family protein [Spongiibacteraceae bacterium]
MLLLKKFNDGIIIINSGNNASFRDTLHKLFLPLLLLISGCTAHYPVNEPIDEINTSSGYRPQLTQNESRSDTLFVGIAFSGGGTRAAAFSYGVLEALRDITIQWEGKERRLIDEIDTISSVSGGSFTAAYFGLFGDRIFEDYEEKFLKQDVEGYLKSFLWKPWTWFNLGSSLFGRSDYAAEYYDEILFEGKTFADIISTNGPLIQINATEVSTGTQLTFLQGQFDLLCSDLSTYPVSRAVAASSAVPVLFSSITLDNHAGSCGYQRPLWLDDVLNSDDDISRRRHLAEKYVQWLDRETYPYLHLYDGGLTDNLGVRPFLNRITLAGDAWELAKSTGKQDSKRLVFIVVNAQAESKTYFSRLASPVPLFDTIMGATSIPLNEYTFESLVAVKSAMADFKNSFVEGRCADRASKGEDKADCDEFEADLIVIDMDDIKDKEKRERLKQLPTSFVLKSKDVDELIESAKTIINNSKEFQNL